MPCRRSYLTRNVLETIYGLQRFGIKLGLGIIRRILKGLGNPQNRYATIHVAGTNGKGSVASALANILQQAGYKTGLYTSPHLVRFNERICINRREISNKAVVAAYQRVKRGSRRDSRAHLFRDSPRPWPWMNSVGRVSTGR